jgi:hypothetical protein
VQEVHVDPVERRLELREGVEPRLLRPPVEARTPVLDELAQVADIGAVGPRLSRRLVGEARARETLAQIGDRLFGDVQSERFDARLPPARRG